jgi:hypothetical protein
MAQETTSSIRGLISADGSSVSGATVSIVHTPSGTTSTVVTGNTGAFSAPGLRPGGPYKVTVTAGGHPSTSIDGVYLSVAEPLNLPIDLGGGEEVLDEATVTGQQVVALSAGPSSTYGREDIAGVTSVQRDIRDIVRHDPYASFNPSTRGVAIAGTNNRMNRFAVDGVRFSDNFGLNQGGLPTTRGPVPLDAVEQLSVKIAPYDITEGDFQGGSINVVLRSGSNDFTGSAFYSFTNSDLTGSKSRGTPVLLDFESKVFGAFVSGAIIKDKLFFALSYEDLNQGDPAGFGLAGAPTVVPNLTQGQVNNASAIAQAVYAYDTLGIRTTLPETDKKYTGKLDWNINDNHRLSYTGIFQRGYLQSTGTGSSSVASPFLNYRAYATNEPENVDSHVVQLNSSWGNGFSTELRANKRTYDKIPSSLGAPGFAQFQVCLDPVSTGNIFECTQGVGTTAGTPRLYFGTEAFSQADVVKQDQKGLELVARYDIGNHSLKAQAAYSDVGVVNLFVANSLGTYYFDSLAAFQARQASTLTWQYSITGSLDDVIASFGYKQMTFGLQDSWNVMPGLNVTAGVRMDTYKMDDRPPQNNFFTARYGFANTNNIDGLEVVQPRISATWKPLNRLTVRAGGGLFNGGAPDVFLGNSFSVAGVYGNTLSNITRSTTAPGGCRLGTAAASPALALDVCNAALNGVTGLDISGRAALFNYLATNTGALSGAPVNAMSDDFKLPSSWKTNLSVDYRADFGNPLGDGWLLGADIYKSWVKDAAQYTDLRLTRVGTAPDGRPVYRDTYTNGTNADLLMSNTSRGQSTIYSMRVNKAWDWFDLGLSYSLQDIKTLSDMGDPFSGGSTASGTYGVPMYDPNMAAYGTSAYQTRNNWKFSLDFHHAFVGELVTRASLGAELRSGAPYSLTMNSPGSRSIFGTTGSATRYLMYIPNVTSITADPKVTYASVATFNAVKAFVEANGLTQGEVIGKYTERSPDWFSVGLHLEQELPAFFEGSKFKVFADMENLLNMINDKWGSYRTYGATQALVTVDCTNKVSAVCGPASQYIYSNYTAPNLINSGRIGLWNARIGLRLEF